MLDKNVETLERYFAIYLHYWSTSIFLRRTIHVICYSCYIHDLTALFSSRIDVETLKCLDNDHLAEYQCRQYGDTEEFLTLQCVIVSSLAADIAKLYDFHGV